MSRQKAAAATLVLHWNTAYPVGQAVELLDDRGRKSRWRTRSAAWIHGSSAMVLLEGRVGSVNLAKLAPVVEGAAA